MPYQTARHTWETARKMGHVPLVESDFVRSHLRHYRVHAHETVHDVADHLLVPADNLGDPGLPLAWALAFDGSSQEVAVNDRYPSTRVGYLQIAGVLVNLLEMQEQSRQPLVDPAVIRRATHESLLSIVMPGSNVCREDCDTVCDSWRLEMFEIFRDYTIENKPLLDYYFRFLEAGQRAIGGCGQIVLGRCAATRQCPARNIVIPKSGATCPQCQGALYPTDILRVHEEVQDLNANETALGRLRTVLEHLAMLCYLDYLFDRLPRVLSSVAFILDGPLALFGPQAPLKRAIAAYLQSAATEMTDRGYRLPVIVGIEKSGQFAEHAAQIASHIPNRTLMRLPDDYIFQRILASRPSTTSAFGEDTYYGRKFFYKSARGQVFTITVPYMDSNLFLQHHADDPVAYATLPATLALLDGIGTKLYSDAAIPITLAHSFASIPLGIGSKVLTLMSKEFLDQTP